MALALLLLCLGGCSREQRVPPAIARTPPAGARTTAEVVQRSLAAATPLEEHWAQFRRTFPLHIQVVALSAAAPDGTRTLIVSEPPPHMTSADILLPLAPILRSHRLKKPVIGCEGSVTDLVAAIGGSEADVAAAVGVLYRRLFFTSYKAYVLQLPVRRTSRRYDLDLDVAADEIHKWIIADAEPFVPVEGGAPLPSPALFDLEVSAVYRSSRRGLVAWWIPAGAPIDGCRAQARQFALDSDLIVGSIGNAAGTLLVGRERIVPVDSLPPLRVETIVLPGFAHAVDFDGMKVVAVRSPTYVRVSRVMAAALHMPDDSPDPAAVPMPDPPPIGSSRRVGWTASARRVDGAGREATGAQVSVERGENIYFIEGDGMAGREAYEQTAVTDAIVAYMRFDRSREPLLLDLRNFQPKEGMALVQECESQLRAEGRPRPVSGLLRDKKETDVAVALLRSHEFDLARSKIAQALAESGGHVEGRLAIEAPRRGRGPRMTTSIRLRFRENTPRAVAQRIMNQVAAAVATVARSLSARYDSRFDGFVFNQLLSAEIKRIRAEAGDGFELVDHRFSDGGDEFRIV